MKNEYQTLSMPYPSLCFLVRSSSLLCSVISIFGCSNSTTLNPAFSIAARLLGFCDASLIVDDTPRSYKASIDTSYERTSGLKPIRLKASTVSMLWVRCTSKARILFSSPMPRPSAYSYTKTPLSLLAISSSVEVSCFAQSQSSACNDSPNKHEEWIRTIGVPTPRSPDDMLMQLPAFDLWYAILNRPYFKGRVVRCVTDMRFEFRKVVTGVHYSNLFWLGWFHLTPVTGHQFDYSSGRSSMTKIVWSKQKVRSYYLPHPMTEPFYRYKLTNNSWQEKQDSNFL